MFIRIEYENCDSELTRNTVKIFYSAQNGTCLSSKRAYCMMPEQLRNIKNPPVSFLYVDIDVLNKQFNGVLQALGEIQKYPGVKRVDILPILRDGDGIDEYAYYELLSCLEQYIKGV